MLVGHYVNVIIMIARHGAKIIKVNYSQVSSRRSAATEGSASYLAFRKHSTLPATVQYDGGSSSLRSSE